MSVTVIPRTFQVLWQVYAPDFVLWFRLHFFQIFLEFSLIFVVQCLWFQIFFDLKVSEETKYSRKTASFCLLKNTHFSNVYLSLRCFIDEGKEKQFGPTTGKFICKMVKLLFFFQVTGD